MQLTLLMRRARHQVAGCARVEDTSMSHRKVAVRKARSACGDAVQTFHMVEPRGGCQQL